MKPATIWIFACLAVAVMANEDELRVFIKAVKGWNEDESDSKDNHSTTTEKLWTQGVTKVIRDVVSLGRLDYTAKDDNRVFLLTFYNASLEGLSRYTLQKFTQNISSQNPVDHQFQVNYANITFKGILDALRYVLDSTDRTIYNYRGPMNVTLNNLTVNGILRVYIDDNGRFRKPKVHIDSSTMSTEDFQLANTEWKYYDDLVRFIKNQLERNPTNPVKQTVIDRVIENIVDFS